MKTLEKCRCSPALDLDLRKLLFPWDLFFAGQVRHFSLPDRAVSPGKAENSLPSRLGVSLVQVFSRDLRSKTIQQTVVATKDSFWRPNLHDSGLINTVFGGASFLAFLTDCWWILIKMMVWSWVWNYGFCLLCALWGSGEEVLCSEGFPASLEGISCTLMLLLKR